MSHLQTQALNTKIKDVGRWMYDCENMTGQRLVSMLLKIGISGPVGVCRVFSEVCCGHVCRKKED